MSGELILSPEEALVQRLSASPTEQFYDWERRGRGWEVWDRPSYLEPPFRPFLRYRLPALPAVDDGRRHTLGSRLAEKVIKWWGGQKAPASGVEVLPPDFLALFDEPEVPPYHDDDELIELQIVLPPNAKVSNDTFSALLLSLAYCSCPLSFEVVGTAETIIVQLVCRECDAEQVKEQLVAHFPEARVGAVAPFLSRLWLDKADAPAVVAEFGLSREFMLPLKTLPAALDPLVAITGALAKLREGEIGLLQVLFESVRNPWAESIFRAVTNNEGGSFFDNAPEMVGLAKQKIRSPLFAAVIRVAAKSEEEKRAWQIVKNLAGGLAHLSNPTVNELLPLNNDGYDADEHEEDVIRRQSHRGGMLLNTEELVSLVHLPTAAVRAPKLVRTSLKTKAAPKLAIGHELVLGVNVHEGEMQTVTLSTDQRVKHTYVIGASGTGKSTFLLNCILQDIEKGNGLAVLDPHGDLIDQILERIPEERWSDVVFFDPSDEEYPIGFNILSAHSETEKQLLSSDLVSVFKRLSTSWGDQMTSVLGNAILAFLESERGGTLADLRRFLVEKEFRQEFLKTVKDSENVYFWQKEFPLLAGKPQAPLLTRLDTFLRPKLIRHMVVQKENKLDFGAIMNGRQIFLAKLAQGGIGEENAYLLGTLIVSKFHQMALARQEMKAAERRPFYLYIDEFHNFVTPSMASILAGARKYRLGLVLAHQELRQLGQGATEIASAVIANPYTRVCFRLGDQDAKKLADGLSFFDARDLQNLGTGEAICRVERAEFDFNLRTAPIASVENAVANERVQRITQLSRQRYGTPRHEVLAELARATYESGKPKTLDEVKQSNPSESNADSAPSPDSEDCAPPAEYVSSEVSGQQINMPESVLATVITPIPRKPRMTASPAELPTPGRGGKRHKYIQQLIKQWAEGMGWRAEIEKTILNGAGSVDVALKKGSVTVACEISITTGVEQECANIEKCLKAGYDHVVALATEERQAEKLKAAYAKQAKEGVPEQVRFLTLESFFALVEGLEAQAASHESTVKGYKVKIKYKTIDEDGKAAKKQRLAQLILDSLKKTGKKN